MGFLTEHNISLATQTIQGNCLEQSSFTLVSLQPFFFLFLVKKLDYMCPKTTATISEMINHESVELMHRMSIGLHSIVTNANNDKKLSPLVVRM